MEELSIEEKAKAYDEAYKKVAVRFGSNVADEIFLKYSEEERIRKAILWCIRTVEIELGCKDVEGIDVAELKSWLEKKGEKGAKGNERKIPNSEQKPAEWSKEDEQYIIDTLNLLSFGCSSHSVGEVKDFLKSIKDRVQIKPQQEWSEEDEEIHRKCICAMRASACGFPEEEKFVEQVDNWLKCLKERYNWRPSDEQMADLWNMVCECRPADQQLLQDLYYGLKTLRGE